MIEKTHEITAEYLRDDFDEWKNNSGGQNIQSFLTELQEDTEKLKSFLEEHSIHFFLELGKDLILTCENGNESDKKTRRNLLFVFLNLARRRELLVEVNKHNIQGPWFDCILAMIKLSDFTIGKLIEQRANQYGDKCLFKEIHDGQMTEHSWQEIRQKIQTIAANLLEYRKKNSITGPVAILSENSLEMVCIDLACLSVGIVDVPIPANSVEGNIAFILNHSQSTLLFLSNDRQLAKVNNIRNELKQLHSVILIDSSRSIAMGNILTYKDFLNNYNGDSFPEVTQAIEDVSVHDVATYMYTSGTTEASKGIIFTHLNIISKRFARAIALPEISDQDTFLCYLPLFHTFGRYFEMMGSLFWGSIYVFMESPKVDVMISNMQLAKPTIFISIPKKWIQLFEKIAETVDIDTSPKKKIKQTVEHFSGGKLTWGLSAAGYLDPDIFRFFQENGVEIMSGFGMTEAAGGITMTPPFQYRVNSVGKALPGIDIKLADDGEMLIRGPYVMQGYLHREDTGIDAEGWFHTGDIFIEDKQGFFEIVDRKKEIYKNVRGETIAPQRIENLFQDFDAVQRVFLVGDNREYNTVLIYPNWDYEQLNLRKLSHFKMREFFGSLIVSVNRFLAPYERIINFEIIHRDFDAGQGELTPKNTYKRKIVEKHFKEYIEKMYSSEFVSLKAGAFEVRIPNWFLKEKGITSADIRFEKDILCLTNGSAKLTVKSGVKKSGKILIGSFWYQTKQHFIDLSQFIFHPSLWVGNDELQQFIGDSIYTSARDHSLHKIQLTPLTPVHAVKPKQKSVTDLNRMIAQKVLTIEGLHKACYVFTGFSDAFMDKAATFFEMLIREGEPMLMGIARDILKRFSTSSKRNVREKALWVLLITEKSQRFRSLFEQYIQTIGSSLNMYTLSKFVNQNFLHSQLNCIFDVMDEYAIEENWARLNLKKRTLISLLNLITEYGIRHPAAYKSIRTELINWSLIEFEDAIANHARECVNKLVVGFRKWLGKNLTIAVDPETSLEYGWDDVLTFEEDIDPQHKERIFAAFKKYSIIREAIFLFTKGTLIQLQEIALSGVWISKLGTMHGKTVYRVSVQTNHFGAFDFAINVNNSLSQEEIQSEMDWLICAGSLEERKPLVEDFGGYWPEFDLWTEEFINGDTVDKFLARLARKTLDDDEEKIRLLWIYLAWSGISAYIDFWCRTGRRLEIADPTAGNVIVPSHDYQIGFRIISISKRKKFDNIVDMIFSFYDNFIKPVEDRYDNLRGQCKWSVIFAGFLEILGETEGINVLEQAVKLLDKSRTNPEYATLKEKLLKFINHVREQGYRPKRLFFAIQRYLRWVQLNPEATARAKMQTLQELHTTYTLSELEPFYPGTRIQYFRDTVFTDAAPQTIRTFNDIIKSFKANQQSEDALIRTVSKMSEEFHFNDEEKSFLAQMTYHHLGHKDTAEIVSLGTQGHTQSALMTFIEDDEGNRYGVRSPANPKEIVRLYKLFNAANLPVEFRHEHQYLVVLNERIQVIGGLFYRPVDKQHVHLEKIVVDARFRRKTISDGLMNEFFNRIQSKGAKIVTVGYLRPEYFYKFGFKIDQRYGNMVKRFEKKTGKKIAADMVEQF